MSESAARGDLWCTPPEVLELVREVAPIALDPCSNPSNPTGASIFAVAPGAWPADEVMPWSARIDGFSFSWATNAPGGLVFANYPYSDPTPWVARCAAEAAHGAEVIALGQCDPSTNWWHEHVVPPSSQAVCFWHGRLTFVGAPGPARFAVFLAYWGRRPARFADVFRRVGAIWTA